MQEQRVLRKLSEAWNAFLKLEGGHPDDQEDFRRAIHAAENIVLARFAPYDAAEPVDIKEGGLNEH